MIAVAAFMLLAELSTWYSAQELNKEVYVVRPYEPTLSDAVKINFLPENKEVEITMPHLNIPFHPNRLENSFTGTHQTGKNSSHFPSKNIQQLAEGRPRQLYHHPWPNSTSAMSGQKNMPMAFICTTNPRGAT